MTTISSSVSGGSIGYEDSTQNDTLTIDSGVTVQAEYGLVLDYDDTVHNSGIISGSESGVYFVISGVLVNASTGQISGGDNGVDLDFSSGTIGNSGTISGGYAGIVNRGGSVVNAAGAVIEGGTIGVNAGSGAAIALTNSGDYRRQFQITWHQPRWLGRQRRDADWRSRRKQLRRDADQCGHDQRLDFV